MRRSRFATGFANRFAVRAFAAGGRIAPAGFLAICFVGCLVGCVAVCLTGCGDGGSFTTSPPQPGWTALRSVPGVAPLALGGTKKAWTFLVYMNGANDLDPDSALNIAEMEYVGSSSAVNMVVQWKRDAGWNGATRRYYIEKNATQNTVPGDSSLELSTNPSADMGLAQTLQDFVQWGVKAFPAQRYCLVLWDHGAGWRTAEIPANTPTRSAAHSAARTAARSVGVTRGISYDDLTGSHIDTSQLNGAIAVGSGFRWDLVAMDASLMQMVEVDYQMRDQALYIAGSEESPSALGYPYAQILADLVANPSMDGKAFGTDIAQQFAAYYGGDGEDPTYTQSVVDASQLSALAPAVDSLGAALLAASTSSAVNAAANSAANAAASAANISAARSAAESVLSPDYAGDYRDLTDFTNLLIAGGTGVSPTTDVGVVQAANRVQSALHAAIVTNVHGTQHPNMHGLTVFLVAPTEYASIETAQANGLGPGFGSELYTDLAFTQAAPHWAAFLAGGPP